MSLRKTRWAREVERGRRRESEEARMMISQAGCLVEMQSKVCDEVAGAVDAVLQIRGRPCRQVFFLCELFLSPTGCAFLEGFTQ